MSDSGAGVSAGRVPGHGRWNTLALLCALCFFLSAIEYLVPKPLPFMRIGLANLPVLLAIHVLGAKDFFLLVLLKVVGQGLIGGTFLSFVFLFSIAGTFASALVMYALGRLSGGRLIGFVGMGCAGAMVSNGAQLVLARYLVFGEAVRYLVPPFLAAGFVAGIGLGMVCEYFCRRSSWYALRSGLRAGAAGDPGIFLRGVSRAGVPAGTAPGDERRLGRSRKWDSMFAAEWLFIAGLVMALVFLHDRSMPAHVARFLFFCLLAWLSGKKIGLLSTVVFIAGVVFFNVLAPHGRVLFVLGPLRVTQGSLFLGLERAVTMAGLMMLSRACVRSSLGLPGKPGLLLAKAMRMLELMREKKAMIGKGHVIAGIDGMLLELEAADTYGPGDDPPAKPRPNGKGLLLLGAIVAFVFTLGVAVPLAMG
ncbi:MAG: Gx transporter family protein [Treponema sp.]|nr:Gx transporter family protein [Treponema sp.]